MTMIIKCLVQHICQRTVSSRKCLTEVGSRLLRRDSRGPPGCAWLPVLEWGRAADRGALRLLRVRGVRGEAVEQAPQGPSPGSRRPVTADTGLPVPRSRGHPRRPTNPSHTHPLFLAFLALLSESGQPGREAGEAKALAAFTHAISFSRASSQLRDQTASSVLAGGNCQATREALCSSINAQIQYSQAVSLSLQTDSRLRLLLCALTG